MNMHFLAATVVFGGFLAKARHVGGTFVQLCMKENTGDCVGAWANSECTNIDFGGDFMTDMELAEGVPYVSGYVAPRGYCRIYSEPDCAGLSAIMTSDMKKIFPFRPESMSCSID
ncbi:hypothetical protein CP533_2366 [Ophiocordyceps camponoti-saundersi (nom. inval.)]|nr:hypothetical protein CP533_2366 [Ophiocordyceps camponoti-saundersi (nom. inval.)]